MSIVVVVKKDKDIVIASDSLITQGSLLIDSKYRENHHKFIKYKDTWIGSTSYAMSIHMLQHALQSSEDEFLFDSVESIYNSMLKLHQILKKEYFLSPKNKDANNQTVESTNLDLLIANSSGIYTVGADKNIDKLTKFWASGTGTRFALGAMFHIYDKDKYDAKKIAQQAIETTCIFDEYSALPIHIEEITCQ